MSYLISIWIVSSFSICSYGQTFEDRGYFVPVNDGKLYTKAPTLSNPVKPSSDQIKAYKNNLLVRVNAAIYSLQDDSLGLENVYKHLWGNDFYKTLLYNTPHFRDQKSGKLS